MNSLTLSEKIEARFAPDPNLVDVAKLIDNSQSMARFDSQDDFAKYLAEGSLLNISVIGSKALSVPCGEYLVWMTDAGHTMLVPTGQTSHSKEVFEHVRDPYEVQTRDLMANWNKLERVLSEDAPPNFQQGGIPNEMEEPAANTDDESHGEFQSTIDVSTVDRTPILRAMQDRGYTVTSLAAAVNVDPPAISRILRTPKDTQGDPGGRNPSMGLASLICNTLRLDPTAAFPDIFSADRYDARHAQGNAGSGDHGHHGKGMINDLNESIEILEATEEYDVLCENIATTDMPFGDFWKQAFWPAVRRIRQDTTLTEFVQAMQGLVMEWGWRRTPQRTPAQNQAQEQGFNNFLQQTDRTQAAAQKMNAAIMPAIHQAFGDAMKKLKQDLQQVQMKTNANPKIAPHAWEVINRFYRTVMKAGKDYTPQWKSATRGQAPSYDAAYQKARSEFGKPQQPAQPAQRPVQPQAAAPQTAAPPPRNPNPQQNDNLL